MLIRALIFSPRKTIVELHGLRDIVKRPGLHGLHGHIDGSFGGNDHDVDFGIDPFDGTEDLDPVHPRHTVIEQDQVIMALPDTSDRPLAVFGLADDMPLLLEEIPEHLPLRPAVFHHQDAELLHEAIAPLPFVVFFAGRRISKVVPSPFRLRTRISPP
jgi:hypothetical protein